MRRRTFLTGLGASTLGALGATAATADGESPAVGDVDNEQRLPIEATGSVIHVLNPIRDDGGEVAAYEHQQYLFSGDTEERYGRTVIPFEPEYVPQEWIPTNDLRRSETLDSRYRSRTDLNEHSHVAEQKRARRIVGVPEEHREAYRQITSNSRVETVGSTDVPLFLFESEDDADGGGILARRAPVNVVWNNRDASSANTVMENGWGAGNDAWDNSTPEEALEDVIPGFEFGTRYARDPQTDTIYAHDYDIQQADGESCGFPYRNHWSQWHIRAFDFGDSDIGAFGNVHWDPCDHNQAPWRDMEPWRYTEARETVETFWENYWATDTEEIWLNNTIGISAPGDSHDGRGVVID